jgi:hypothetical protein
MGASVSGGMATGKPMSGGGPMGDYYNNIFSMQGLPGQTTPEGDEVLGYADDSGNIMSSPDGTGTIRGQLPMGMGGGSTGGMNPQMMQAQLGQAPTPDDLYNDFAQRTMGQPPQQSAANPMTANAGMGGKSGGFGPASPMMTAPPTARGPMPMAQPGRPQPQAMQGNPNFQGGLRAAPTNYRPPMNSMAGGVPSGRPGIQQRMQNITPSNYQPAPRTMFQKQMQTQAQPRPTTQFISQGAGGPLIQGFGRR